MRERESEPKCLGRKVPVKVLVQNNDYQSLRDAHVVAINPKRNINGVQQPKGLLLKTSLADNRISDILSITAKKKDVTKFVKVVNDTPVKTIEKYSLSPIPKDVEPKKAWEWCLGNLVPVEVTVEQRRETWENISGKMEKIRWNDGNDNPVMEVIKINCNVGALNPKLKNAWGKPIPKGLYLEDLESDIEGKVLSVVTINGEKDVTKFVKRGSRIGL